MVFSGFNGRICVTSGELKLGDIPGHTDGYFQS